MWNAKGKTIAIGAALAVFLFAGAGAWYFYAVDKPAGKDPVVVSVPKEATGAEIADMLEEKGVIRSAGIFRAAMRVTGAANALQHGYYRLTQGLTVREAIEALRHGRAESVTVTIPEGMTVRQMVALFQNAHIKGAADFEKTAASYVRYDYMKAEPPAPILGEGFLWADTYEIPLDFSAKDICDLLYEKTDSMLTPDIREKAKEKHLSLYQLMTIASLVEREARLPEDQVPIASVILTRLSRGMPLQIDATVQYALGTTKPELTYADLEISSPYNTYLHEGLPPGPIAAPGLPAIQAVLAAEPGDVLYYVAQKDGHHVFTKTLAEHEAKIEEIYGKT